MTTDTTTTAPVSDLTAGDMLMTLNGFDEIAIAARFGVKLADLRVEGEAITLGRALIFVDLRRKGAKDADAYTACMLQTMTEVMGYFTPEAKKAKKAKKAKASRPDATPPGVGAGAEGNG